MRQALRQVRTFREALKQVRTSTGLKKCAERTFG